jgi:GNAT superfamily N-acetyltransferase
MRRVQIDRLNGPLSGKNIPRMHDHPASMTCPLELADSRKVDLSLVHPQDATAERAFVGALSLNSRYRRFHFGLRELSPEQARAMTEIDQHHHVAFVALAAKSEAIAADARYVIRADSADAEFAIAVADEWQGAGLGRELLVRLSAHAREHGVRRLFGDVLWGNNAMLGLARELGAVLKRRPGDATVVQVEFGFDTANESTPGASDTLCTNALSSAPAMHS